MYTIVDQIKNLVSLSDSTLKDLMTFPSLYFLGWAYLMEIFFSNIDFVSFVLLGGFLVLLFAFALFLNY